MFQCTSYSFSLISLSFFFVLAGVPRPNVTWYLENTVIDDSHKENDKQFIVNRLVFPRIGRQHVNARLICMAGNSNLLPSVSKVLVLDVNCKSMKIYLFFYSLFVILLFIFDLKIISFCSPIFSRVICFNFNSASVIGSNIEQTFASVSWKDGRSRV